MSTFVALLCKDILEQWRTYKLLSAVLILLAFGLMSPLVARYTPELVESFASDLEITVRPPQTSDAIDQITRNLGQMAPFAAILLAMGAIATEKQRGTAALILVKPVTRTAFIVSKFAALSATLFAGVALGCIGGYFYTVVLFEALPVAGFTMFTLLMVLAIMVIASVTFLASTLFRSSVPAACVGLAAFAVMAVLSVIPGLGDYMPMGLYWPARELALGNDPGALIGPVLANLGMVASTLLLAWLSFRRQTL